MTSHIHYGFFNNRALEKTFGMTSQEIEDLFKNEPETAKAISFKIYGINSIIAKILSLYGAAFQKEIGNEVVYVNTNSYAAYKARLHDVNGIKSEEASVKIGALEQYYNQQKEGTIDGNVIQNLSNFIKHEIKEGRRINEIGDKEFEERINEFEGKKNVSE